MKIRLQEIEFGSRNLNKSKDFYNSILGLDAIIDKEGLKVFQSGIAGVDFNTSKHLPTKISVTSFLTDNLPSIIERLNSNGIKFDGPKKSHLGMMTIEVKDPDGYLLRINQPTDESPTWLKV